MECHKLTNQPTLDGRVVVVTGAARGLGRAFAHRLARDAAAIAVVDVDLHSYRQFNAEQQQLTADSTDQELRAAGSNSRGYEADLTDPAATRDVMNRIFDDFGRMDGIVCNAGGGSGGVNDNKASDLSIESLEAMLTRNLYTTVNCCVAAVPMLKQGDGGAIVNVASINGLKPMPGGSYSHYGVAKAATIMYTKYLALDLGPSRIRANVLAPGTVPTGRLTEVWSRDGAPDPTAEIPLRRLPAIDEIAEAVLYLVSGRSSYVTGQVLTVDGGWTL